MPVTKVGLVYYADDPDKKIFRVIFPIVDDSEIEERCRCGGEIPFVGIRLPPCGELAWKAHLDPAREPVLVKVPKGKYNAPGWAKQWPSS